MAEEKKVEEKKVDERRSFLGPELSGGYYNKR